MCFLEGHATLASTNLVRSASWFYRISAVGNTNHACIWCTLGPFRQVLFWGLTSATPCSFMVIHFHLDLQSCFKLFPLGNLHVMSFGVYLVCI